MSFIKVLSNGNVCIPCNALTSCTEATAPTRILTDGKYIDIHTGYEVTCQTVVTGSSLEDFIQANPNPISDQRSISAAVLDLIGWVVYGVVPIKMKGLILDENLVTVTLKQLCSSPFWAIAEASAPMFDGEISPSGRINRMIDLANQYLLGSPSTKPGLSLYHDLANAMIPFCSYCGVTATQDMQILPYTRDKVTYGNRTRLLCTEHGLEWIDPEPNFMQNALQNSSSLMRAQPRLRKVKPTVSDFCWVCSSRIDKKPGGGLKLCDGCPFTVHDRCISTYLKKEGVQPSFAIQDKAKRISSFFHASACSKNRVNLKVEGNVLKEFPSISLEVLLPPRIIVASATAKHFTSIEETPAGKTRRLAATKSSSFIRSTINTPATWRVNDVGKIGRARPLGTASDRASAAIKAKIGGANRLNKRKVSTHRRNSKPRFRGAITKLSQGLDTPVRSKAATILLDMESSEYSSVERTPTSPRGQGIRFHYARIGSQPEPVSLPRQIFHSASRNMIEKCYTPILQHEENPLNDLATTAAVMCEVCNFTSLYEDQEKKIEPSYSLKMSSNISDENKTSSQENVDSQVMQCSSVKKPSAQLSIKKSNLNTSIDRINNA